MLKPRCGFYLKQESSSKVGIEVYDIDLLVRSLDTSDFKEYCKNLASLYHMKPDNVESLVYLYLFLNKAQKLGMSFDEVKERMEQAGLRVEREPEEQ